MDARAFPCKAQYAGCAAPTLTGIALLAKALSTDEMARSPRCGARRLSANACACVDGFDHLRRTRAWSWSRPRAPTGGAMVAVLPPPAAPYGELPPLREDLGLSDRFGRLLEGRPLSWATKSRPAIHARAEFHFAGSPLPPLDFKYFFDPTVEDNPNGLARKAKQDADVEKKLAMLGAEKAKDARKAARSVPLSGSHVRDEDRAPPGQLRRLALRRACPEGAAGLPDAARAGSTPDDPQRAQGAAGRARATLSGGSRTRRRSRSSTRSRGASRRWSTRT